MEQEHSEIKRDALSYIEEARERLLDTNAPIDFSAGHISGILNTLELFGVITHEENAMIFKSELRNFMEGGKK